MSPFVISRTELSLVELFDTRLLKEILPFSLLFRTADGEGLVEKHYVFLKRLCQVLCSLGSQLCALVVGIQKEASLYFLAVLNMLWYYIIFASGLICCTHNFHFFPVNVPALLDGIFQYP